MCTVAPFQKVERSLVVRFGFGLKGMNLVIFQGAAVPGGRVALPQKQKGVPGGLRRVDDTVPR